MDLDARELAAAEALGKRFVNLAGFVVPMAGTTWLGTRLARRPLRLRTPAWLDEVTRTRQVPPARLAELLRGVNALR